MKKYQVVANKIRKYIAEKNLKHGDQLPKITDLMEQFKVGKSTVLQALTLLDQQGMVYKIQGSGIFVRTSPQTGKGFMSLGTNRGFGDVLSNPTSVVYSVKEVKQPPKWAQELLGKKPCFEIKRLRKDNDKPFVYEESYYLKSVVPFLTPQLAEGSLFSYIRKALGHEIRFSDKYMQIKKINDQEAKILQLQPGDPALEVHDFYYLDDGEIFDASRLVYHYKNAKFFDQSADELI
ncbi:GntR family transcriptional regulator [uncultured Lactobacillus sp.]|uniref:GntR family transcriptional regulator n=1 Tax=uncultured Lactobacillus sp. TaxID=153152 RepID=UPI0026154BF5|nr:GntR family transcriptional regulator [uncultured Lactobacillus sp.]